MVRIAKIFSGAMIVSLFVTVAITTFLAGYGRGYGVGWNEAMNETQKYLSDTVSATTAPTTSSVPVARQKAISPSWGGPQLWEAVNKRRTEFGVNPMSVKEEICTIASIRLNQILELGKLDGHAGFSNMPTDRPDLKWIFEKYNLAEFLVAGAESPQEAVSLWENTLGHKELLNGGQYVWGCIYAQAGFGVAIAAY
jgi:uncharacterized protein YkwD